MGRQKKYSEQTKRHRTKYPGVYERQGERVKGEPDTCFDITYKKEGKKIWERAGWKSLGFTIEYARQLRIERLHAIQHDKELPREKKKAPFFKEVAKKYMAWAEDNKVRAGADDRGRYKAHLAPYFDDKRMDEISSFDLERLKNDLVKAGLAPASIKHCLVLIRQIFNKAREWGLYSGTNPIKGVKMPTVQNLRERFLSPDEADLLLNALKADPHRTRNPGEKKDMQLHSMALLSLYTGMRAGEIFNLKGHDLDFENEVINISDPKNKTARKAYMTEDVKTMLLSRKPAIPSGLVFPARSDEKKNQKKRVAVSQAFRRTVEKIGLNDGIEDPRQLVTFHTLRHTFASWLAIQGTPIYTIAKLMGHKSLSMSERYSHLSPDSQRTAVKGLEKNLKQRKNVVPLKK